MAHTDLVLNTSQPPIIEISLHRPATSPLALHDPAFIPVRVLLLCCRQRHTTLFQNALQLLPFTVRRWYVSQQIIQLYPAPKLKRYHRIAFTQFCSGADYPEPLHKTLHLRLLNRGRVPVPNLPGQGILQFLQIMLILRIHRNRLGQNIIQVQPPASSDRP